MGEVEPVADFPVGAIVMVFLAAAVLYVDVALLQPIFEVLVNDDRVVRMLAVGFVVGSAVTAAAFGVQLAKGRRGWAALTGFAWVLIAGGTTFVRAHHEEIVGELGSHYDPWLAVLTASLLLASAVDIAIYAPTLLGPRGYLAFVVLRIKLWWLSWRRGRAIARRTSDERFLAQLAEERDRTGRLHEIAQQRIAFLERELYAFSRDRVVEALGHPRNGGLIAQPIAYKADQREAAGTHGGLHAVDGITPA